MALADLAEAVELVPLLKIEVEVEASFTENILGLVALSGSAYNLFFRVMNRSMCCKFEYRSKVRTSQHPWKTFVV